jgi:FkbH-like protein
MAANRNQLLPKKNSHPNTLRELLAQARATEDYGTYMTLCRRRKKFDSDPPNTTRDKDLRIAILGGATTDFLDMPLRLELETLGIASTTFCANFNNFVPEMLDANSQAATFRPHVAVLLVTPFNIADWPVLGDSPEAAQSLADRLTDHWLGLCDTFHGITNCEIVLGNLHLQPARAVGNLGAKLPWDRNNFLRRVNATLSRKAPGFVHIFDIDTLSAIYGVSNWFDPRFWYHAKQPVSFACLVPFVRNLGAIIGALFGRTAKCLVLDLDNTMWGGVVGDDGIGGLKIGEGDAESEAFKAFQEYVLRLKERGLLLAVCSKNEEENALEPFEQLPDMVLKRDDFVAFKANWEPKPLSIELIARELNIGLDALVFVDDNPAERELVRQSLPEVKVVELSKDPADYPRLLDQCGWLETAKLTDEDTKKTDQYRKNIERDALLTQHADYGSYLASLSQKAVVREFEPKYLDRITQLINKTNQFNLTTKRLTRSEVEALTKREDTLTVYVRLLDRFGDNGLISVLIGHFEEDVLYIDMWLMSCRVLKRGVEHLLANTLFDRARSRNARLVHGVYIPTAKNKMVENHFADLGFVPAGTGENGAEHWEILVQDYKSVPVHISIVMDDISIVMDDDL